MPRRKKSDPLDGFVTTRNYGGNSPRILKRSGAGIHGGTSKQRNRRDRQTVRRKLRTAEIAIFLL